MPKKLTGDNKPHRVTLNFSSDGYDQLIGLAEERRITVTDVVRRSVDAQAYLDAVIGIPPDTSRISEEIAPGIIIALKHLR